MRRTGLMIVMVAMLSTTSSGCGTLWNVNGMERLDTSPSTPPDRVRKLDRPPFPFGGVANDVAWIKSADQPIDVVFSLVDLPFSLVGDLLTFPWAAYQSLIVVRQGGTGPMEADSN